MREKNPFGKSRPVDNPYEVWENPQGWTWHVLKKYQLERNEGQYARWFCAVKSPMTYGEWEYGDVYKSEIMMTNAQLSHSAVQMRNFWRH